MSLKKLLEDIRTECSAAWMAIQKNDEPRAEACLKNAAKKVNLYFERKEENAKDVEVDKA